MRFLFQTFNRDMGVSPMLAVQGGEESGKQRFQNIASLARAGRPCHNDREAVYLAAAAVG
jgi:hypothetical protein